jgi:ethanolamine utilization protein EutN
MLVGTVIGKVWSTRKEETLSGLRLLLIRPWRADGAETGETLVAADPIGADVGERVLVVFGRAARHAIGRGQDVGFQTAVVGVVDELEVAVKTRAQTHKRKERT